MKTLLNGVNDVLKRMGAIKGNSGELTTLVDSQRQVLIDLAVACWNEAIIDLYASSEVTQPKEMGTTTITLVNADRDYTLPTDLVSIKWPLYNDSNGYRIEEYHGGWDTMRRDQSQPGNFTGRPSAGVIRPTDGQLYLDRIPGTADAGIAYTLEYDKSLIKSLAADTFPFTDDCYMIMVPAVAEMVKMERDEQNDTKYLVSTKKIKTKIGLAAQLVTMQKPRSDYNPISRYNHSSTDPLEE